jgi:hypothetical protein
MSSPTAPAPALPPQTVRILTPVFAYRLDGADSFTYAGTHKGAAFKVELRPYTRPSDIEGIINQAHVNIRDSIRYGFHHPPAPISHFLLIEVALPGSAYALDMGFPPKFSNRLWKRCACTRRRGCRTTGSLCSATVRIWGS